MSDAIELAKKCGARLCVCNDEGDYQLKVSIDESFTLLLLRKSQLLTFEAAIRRDQIEKDAKICDGIEDEYLADNIDHSGHTAAGAGLCRLEISEQLTKQTSAG